MSIYNFNDIYEKIKNKKVLNYKFDCDYNNNNYIYIFLEDNNTLELSAEGECCSYSLFFDLNLDNIIGYSIKNIEECKNDDDDNNGFSTDTLEDLEEYISNSPQGSDYIYTHKYIVHIEEEKEKEEEKEEEKEKEDIYFGLANVSNGYYDGYLSMDLIENKSKTKSAAKRK